MKRFSIIFTMALVVLASSSCSKHFSVFYNVEYNYETTIKYAQFHGQSNSSMMLVDDAILDFTNKHIRTCKVAEASSDEDIYAQGEKQLAKELAEDYAAAEAFYADLKAKLASGTGFGEDNFKITGVRIVQQRMRGEENYVKNVYKDDLVYIPVKQ